MIDWISIHIVITVNAIYKKNINCCLNFFSILNTDFINISYKIEYFCFCMTQIIPTYCGLSMALQQLRRMLKEAHLSK